MAASSRLLCAWCLVAAAAVACAVPVEAAEALAKVPVTKNSRLGTSIASQQVSAAKKDPAVEVAAAEPVAYRGSESCCMERLCNCPLGRTAVWLLGTCLLDCVLVDILPRTHARCSNRSLTSAHKQQQQQLRQQRTQQ